MDSGDDERRLVRHVVEIDDDLLDQQPHQPLLGARVGPDGVADGRPEGGQVMREAEQRVTINPWPGGYLVVQQHHAPFVCRNTLERRVPSCLQFACDVTLGGSLRAESTCS